MTQQKVVKIFWKISTSPDINNADLIKKSTSRITGLLKTIDSRELEKAMIDDALENIKKGAAVIQSLKIIRKIVMINDEVNTELLAHIMQRDVITQVFETLKKIKSEVRAASQKTATMLNDTTISQLLGDKNYNFETHVLKRLGFIDFILLNSQQPKESVLSSINTIWAELVENSIVDSEANYFKKWFVQLGKDSKKVVSNEILAGFFYDKINVLSEPRPGTGINKRDILMIFTEIFVKMNLLSKKIETVTLRVEEETSYSTEEKAIVKVFPEELDGIDALWNIVLTGKDDLIIKELMPFLTNQYTRPELDKIDPSDGYNDYMKAFINKCIRLTTERVQAEGFLENPQLQKTVGNLLAMISDIIDKTESRAPIKNGSLSSFYRTRTTSMIVDNKISTSFNTPKSIEVKVDGSTTIMQIKQMLSKEIKRTTWKNIRLLKGYKLIEIPDKFNSKSLRDLGINFTEKLTSEFRSAPIQAAESLVFTSNDGSIVNPKAIKAFKQIFAQYADEGKMGIPQIIKYSEGALDEKNLSPDFPQIKELLTKFDQEGKGYLNEDDFIRFYTDACFSKSGPVLSNLRNLGYTDQLIKESDAMSNQAVEDLARDYILSKNEFVHLLYDLTETCQPLAEAAWAILSSLPPMPDILKKILRLEGVKDAKEPNWENIVETKSTIKALYNFYILDLLLEDSKIAGADNPLEGFIEGNPDDFKKAWKRDFIQLGGYQFLFQVLKDFVSKGVGSGNDVTLFGFIMRAVRSYLLATVTNSNPEIYRNIAYIGNPEIPFSVLTGSENYKEAEPKIPKVELPKVVIPAEVDAPSTPPNRVMSSVAIGPMTQEEAVKSKGERDPVKDLSLTTDSKKEMEKYGPLLVEKEEFIEFRNSLKQLQADNHKDIDPIETLRFLVRLCESILNKKQNNNVDELAIIEQSLSIIFCIILNDLQLLKTLVISKDITLLSESTVIRTEENSDFISFFIAGLLTKRGYQFIRFFDNAFKILLREAGSAEVQLVLVKIVFENTLKDGLSLRDTSRHAELAGLLLESICSDHRDPKILVNKDDLNRIVDLENLFLQVFEKVFTVKATSKEEAYSENLLIVGYFKVMERILAIEPKVRDKLSAERPDVIKKIFTECLFNSPDQEEEPKELVCKNFYTRSGAFEMVTEACKGNSANLQLLYESGLLQLSRNLPKINSWSYTSLFGKKSALGFVGIYNPSCICYMNAMLQQFYMTPTFRYALLMANDHEPENVVTVDNRRIDDNVFHQLQRMFAFLDRSERKDYHPAGFCHSFKDYAGQPVNIAIQQDTKEFLDIFFDKLDNTLKPTPFRNVLSDVYGGKHISVIECSICGNLRTREEVFYNLSLEVKNLKNINEGIEKLITEDIISDFKCEACNNKCDVSKRTFIKECPNVLIVHLQRIIFDLDVLMNVKVNNWYEFPQKMNLKNYTYDKFMKDFNQNKEADESEKEGGKTETEEDSTAKGAVEEPENPEITEDLPKDAKEPEDEKKEDDEANFDYNLAGVIVHLGSADIGHYYSFINVNRNDPGRPKM